MYKGNAELSKTCASVAVRCAMALQVHYKYKQQVPDESLRKAEGVKVRKKYPAKIPVSFQLVKSQRTLVVTGFVTSFWVS